MTVAVLFGGKSAEHDVSRVSASAIVQHLRERCDVVVIGIDRSGVWWLQDPDAHESTQTGGALDVAAHPDGPVSIVPGVGISDGAGQTLALDCVFPVLHGENGEDGTVQGALELAGVPYVGSGVTASALGFDKIHAKRLWRERGLPIVPYEVVTAYEVRNDYKRCVARVEAFGYPLFVKPNASGSSVGVSRVDGSGDLMTALDEALRHDSVVLVERAVTARELETAVVGNDLPEAYGPGEVIPTHAFYDYDAKYTDPNGAELVEVAQVPQGIAGEVRRLAIQAYRVCRCTGLARVDCFYDEATGEVFLNEINTMPGFTPISMFPRMVTSAGTSYGDLLLRLVTLATG